MPYLRFFYLVSSITHHFQTRPSHLIIFSINNMACRMLMGTCANRRSLHAESTKYTIIQRPMPPLLDFLRIWVCSPITNHQLLVPNSNFSSCHPSNFRIHSSNINRLFRRPRQGSSVSMHAIRRSKKLVVLAGNVSICS